MSDTNRDWATCEYHGLTYFIGQGCYGCYAGWGQRCPVCDATCVSCATREPAFDSPYGPLCELCVSNGAAEPHTESCADHNHPDEEIPEDSFGFVTITGQPM